MFNQSYSFPQGTGNQTPHVSSAILERLFLDPSMSLFEYSQSSLLAEIPTMLAFPNLHDVYEAWKKHLEERGARVRLNTEVLQVLGRNNDNVILRFKPADDQDDDNSDIEYFDELIFAADADSCLKMLGDQASWMEKKVLGNVKYFYDISVTHYDREYMEKVCHMNWPSASPFNRLFRIVLRALLQGGSCCEIAEGRRDDSGGDDVRREELSTTVLNSHVRQGPQEDRDELRPHSLPAAVQGLPLANILMILDATFRVSFVGYTTEWTRSIKQRPGIFALFAEALGASSCLSNNFSQQGHAKRVDA